MRIVQTDFVLDWIAQKVGTAQLRGLDGATGAWVSCHEAYTPLILAASSLDDGFDARVLARMLQVDERQLARCLAAVVDGGILKTSGAGAGLLYEFADRDLQRAARKAIPPERRPALDRSAADALVEALAEPVVASDGARSADIAIRIARHRQKAGQSAAAARAWRRAAEFAVAAGSPKLAVGCLDQAMAISRSIPSEARRLDELVTLSLMGPLQAQLTGSGSREVAAVYSRCLEISDGLDEAEAIGRFDLLWGVCACVLVHGRIGTARELAARLLQLAEASGGITQRLLATRLHGLSLMLAGEFALAIAAFTAVEELYDFDRDAALRFRYASDQCALALAHRAWAQAIAGERQQSDRASAEALELARRLDHPHTSAHVTCVLAARAQTLGSRNLAAPLATAGLALARRHHFPYWEAWAEMILGWHEAGRHPRNGTNRLEKAIAAYRGTGAGQALPFAHLLRASAELAGGDRAAAVVAADLGLEMSRAHGVTMFDAEILRVKALALGRDGDRSGLLQRALSTARRQGAALFEGRATDALSRQAY